MTPHEIAVNVFFGVSAIALLLIPVTAIISALSMDKNDDDDKKGY